MRTRAVLTKMSTFTAIALFVSLTGCSYWPAAPNNGLLFTNVTAPVAVIEPDATNVRSGEACSTGILGLFSSGTSTVNAARSNAGISNVTIVEERFTQYLLGAYSSYCVVVSGT